MNVAASCFVDRPVHYATYFDRHYLSRGLALYRSLVRHSPPFVLWVLCMDDETRRVLDRLALQHLCVVPLGDLERAVPALLEIKGGRLPVEYYWTCGPAFLCWLVDRDDRIAAITYLDADLYFFGSPEPLWQELGANSVLLVPQASVQEPDETRRLSKYNVGFNTFRRTDTGMACLRRWRDQCLDWCFDRFEDGRFGDQGYLDDWPERFPGVTVTRHTGAGLAPWNVNTIGLTWEDGELRAAGDPVIFCHFGKIRRMTRWLYELHDWRFHRHRLLPVPRRHVYAPYVRELFAVEQDIRRTGGHVMSGSKRRGASHDATRRRMASTNALPWATRLRRFMFVAGRITV